MNEKAVKKFTLILIAFLGYINSMGQCQITAPKIICIGDLGHFSISLPSGSTLASADWNFGDGYTGYGQSPGHLYVKTGTFMVKCKLKLTSGSTCEDSVQLDVLKLPNADYYFKTLDTCFSKNIIEIANISTPANSSQPIIMSRVIWDDGNFDLFNTKHTYTGKGVYKITLEVTDNKGCKHIKNKFVNIVPSLKAKFFSTTDTTCGSTKICLKNTTDTIQNNKNIYTWQFDNGKRILSDYKTRQCFTYKSYKELKVKLIVANIYGCNDSIESLEKIKVDSFTALKMILSDTAICYNNSKPLSLSVQPEGIFFSYNWEINGVGFGYNRYKNDINPKKDSYVPGIYKLRCTIEKGPCKVVIDTHFTIKGPMAVMRIFNKDQCDPAKRVYFTDLTKVINHKKSSRFWTLSDSLGDSCICHRIEDINKYRNCNYSTDWYHKHDYKKSKTLNKVSLNVYDSITGCSDFIIDNVNTKACAFEKKDTLCQGALFLYEFDAGRKPVKFSLDSGKNWILFPGAIPFIYKGLYSVLLMYNNEKEKASDYKDDSIQVSKDSILYTYWYLKDQLLVKVNPNPVFKFTLTGNCKYKDIVVKLKDPLILANETVVVHWGDGNVDTFRSKTDFVLDSIKHRYNRSGMLSSISISRRIFNGCFSQDHMALEFGFNIYLDELSEGTCARKNVCFNLGVYDLTEGKSWNNINKLGTIKLLTGESKVFINDFKPCYQYNSSGVKTIKLIATSTGGCTDSIEVTSIVSDLRTNVTNGSKVFGCGEIKQLFDSTVMISPNINDKIIGYLWDFGNKTYSTTLKDPYHSFTKYGKYEVTHVVKSSNGCSDSVKFIVNVIGPEPQFDIVTDTVGCEPLTVKLRNNSKNCTQYYWRFGDPAQNTLLNNSKTDVSFTYATAGKYYIKLIGIDTFFNTTTNSKYYCQYSFPEDTNTRSVTVLPFLKAGFEGPDTVCVGENIDFKNLSDKRYETLNWDFGDGIKKSSANDSMYNYFYKKPGTFKIILKPDYNVPAGVPKCLDTAEKIIIAKGILANFEYERLCESPLFNFTNTSLPENKSTLYTWDFGQSSSAQNISVEKHPQHDYGFNKGDFTVCLRLQDEFGCADSMCSTFNNDYKTTLIIPNVFTPGSMDGKNDEYDIVIEGEEIYELSIFNRWGHLIFESKTDGEPGLGTNWNGKFENTGNPCPEGTYFYIFDYKNCYGDLNKKRATGTITLIR